MYVNWSSKALIRTSCVSFPFRTFAQKIAMKIIYFFISLLFLVACNDSGNLEKISQETMDIHDEAMEELADMNRVKRQLQERLESDSSQTITQLITDIEVAHKDMMDWMRDYKAPEGMPTKEAVTYMEDQKAKISKNRDDIHAALEAGKKYLEQ